MKGADEYYDLFNGQSQQIGRLFLHPHTHARGKCFKIFLLPEGVEIEGNRVGRRDNVCVYGVTGGQLGWTETYGWLYKGKWQDDFAKIVEERKAAKEAARANAILKTKEADANEKDRINNLLYSY